MVLEATYGWYWAADTLAAPGGLTRPEQVTAQVISLADLSDSRS